MPEEWKREAFVEVLEAIRKSIVNAPAAIRESDPFRVKAA